MHNYYVMEEDKLTNVVSVLGQHRRRWYSVFLNPNSFRFVTFFLNMWRSEGKRNQNNFNGLFVCWLLPSILSMLNAYDAMLAWTMCWWYIAHTFILSAVNSSTRVNKYSAFVVRELLLWLTSMWIMAKLFQQVATWKKTTIIWAKICYKMHRSKPWISKISGGACPQAF